MLASIRKRVWQGGVAAFFAALLVAIPQPTSAAESIPELQWPPIDSTRYVWDTITSPTGDVTIGCTNDNGTLVNLQTIDAAGQTIRNIDPAEVVDDGYPNCIYSPVADKNGNLYGRPYGRNSNNSYGYADLRAYGSSGLKWTYDVGCTTQSGSPVIGADGNIYTISSVNGNRMIGLTSDVEPGTTQPQKILDVPLSGYGICSVQLHAVKEGIVYVENRRAHLYSYSGNKLGSTPVGYYVDRVNQISASGRAFYPIYVGTGSTSSIKIAAYNLSMDRIDWTSLDSLFGHNPYFSSAHPTPDGGVIVMVRRLKDVGGVPSSERVHALIKLNEHGIKVWEEEFPNQDASGNTYNNTRVTVDTNGNIVVLREGSMQTNDPYNSTMPAIAISVYNPSGDAVYGEVMHGNLDTTDGGVYGYDLGGQGYIDPILGPDTLYFLGVCEGSCTSYLETKLYAVDVPGLGLDYPRGAVLGTSPRPSSEYVALGDSFSSGEGVEPFEAGTDDPTWNMCHRSEDAYARLLVDEHGAPSLGSDGFRACSGAVTANITDAAQWNEGIQLDLWPDPTTELVTVTIGGNDIGFGDFASACVFNTCSVGSAAYNDALDKINDDLPSKLEATYSAILDYAPNAEIYVVGYPHVAPPKTDSDSFNLECAYLFDGGANWADARGARDIVTRLNDEIEDRVNSVRALDSENTRLHFVEMDGAESPFKGHEPCGTTGVSWFHNIDQGPIDDTYPFHPNAMGQEGYATVVGTAIN